MSQQINLFNPIFLRQKKHFSALTMVQGMGLILLGAVIMYGYSVFQSVGLQKEALKVRTQLATTQQQLAKVTAEFTPKKTSQALADEVKKAQAEQDALQLAMGRLQQDDLGNKKGYSAYMRAFARQIVSGLWLTGFSIRGAGSAIGIQGRALQPELVPAYLGRLKQEPVLQGKSFATLEMQRPKQDVDATTEGKDKKKTLPAFIDFELRSSGVEKAAAAGAETSGASKVSALTPTPAAQSAEVPAARPAGSGSAK